MGADQYNVCYKGLCQNNPDDHKGTPIISSIQKKFLGFPCVPPFENALCNFIEIVPIIPPTAVAGLARPGVGGPEEISTYYTYICICICIYVYHTHTHTPARARAHARAHTHTHTHTHTRQLLVGYFSDS